MSNSNPKQWFHELHTRISTLAEQFDLDPVQSEQLRESVLGLCKDEYVKGSKSGAAWAFKKSQHRQMATASANA